MGYNLQILHFLFLTQSSVRQLVFDCLIMFSMTKGQCYKTFLYVIYGLVISQSVCPWQYCQPGLMFVGKAGSLPQSAASERCFICLGSSLTSKYQTRLERLARDKHCSILRKFANYGRKKIYNIGPRLPVPNFEYEHTWITIVFV